jgi:hypothetical protein
MAADEDEEEDIPVAAPRAPRPGAFGSVWDSQIGTPSAPAASLAPLGDDEDFDEPEIPEYLIAEQRRGGQRGGRGARGGRSAYQSAMDRERFGRGGGGGQRGGRGINRYPDVSGRQRSTAPSRDERSFGRPQRQPMAQPRGSSEPWSDVPPELEAILRAQVAQKTSQAGAPPADRAASAEAAGAGEQEEAMATPEAAGTDATARKPASRGGRKPVARSSRGKAARDEAGAITAQAAEEPAAPPKRRSTRSKAAASEVTEGIAEAEAPAPKATRARSTKATTARASSRTRSTEDSGATEEAAAAPKRRTRKASTTEAG